MHHSILGNDRKLTWPAAKAKLTIGSLEQSMSIAEILPAIVHLPRGDQLRLVQLVLADLIRQEDAGSTDPYQIWSPYGCDDAAAALQQLLQKSKAQA